SALPRPAAGLPGPALTEADRCLTVEMAMDRLGGVWQQDTALRATLYTALQPHRGPLLAEMEQAGSGTSFRVKDTGAVARLLGQELYLSPSQLRSFCQCQLAYYMEYVLKVKPRRQARMDPAEGGTLIHYILEHALQAEGFADMDEAQLAALASVLARRFMEENLPDPGAQMRYLVTRMARGAAGLLRFVQQELAAGLFAPAAFELEIGEGPGKVPPLTQTTAGGQTVKLIGKIDRVDAYTPEDGGESWLRVVDYKTGTKKFSLTRVLTGQDCQMLLYLFTLTARWPLLKGQEARAGGVEYLLADPPPDSVSRETALRQGAGAVYDRQGLNAGDPTLQNVLDAEQSALERASREGKIGRVKKRGAGQATPEQMENIRLYLEEMVRTMAERLYGGQITARPCQDEHGNTGCLKWCPYRGVCGHVDGENERPHPAAGKDLFMQKEELRWDD
ncbi:MAG: PD-(D/E)XK nuclease family protein, partial [Oscillospiraceae bacterium]|nr:PD-(D/E)XK nuclease family protein [Oscillospiraceae bacterium]